MPLSGSRGKEISRTKAEELGLPSHGNKTSQDREADALKFTCQILNLVSRYYPVLICFDEIDALNDVNEAGFQTAEVIVYLVKRLYDTIQQSAASQGVCFLTVMIPDTWGNTIQLLNQSILDRVVGTGKKPIRLEYLKSNSIIELVKCWLEDFYQQQNLKPEDPIYPFKEDELKKLGQKEKPQVRNVLSWCEQNFKVPK